MKLRHPYRYYLFLFRESVYYLPTVYATIIIVCILLSVFVIYPQIQNFLNINAQVSQLKSQISTLQNNINNINNLNDNDLQSNFDLMNEAVPVDKDFAGAIEAISSAATDTNVILEDYTVVVGSYSSKAQSRTSNNSLTLNISINGSLSGIVNYLTKIKQSLPLMEVQNITVVKNQATMEISVYYVPYRQSSVDLTSTNLSLSPVEQSTLNQLSDWNANTFTAPVNTSSQGNLPLF